MSKPGRLLNRSIIEKIKNYKEEPLFSAWEKRLLFDRRDYELIRIVNDVSSRNHDLGYARRQYYQYFHPHGTQTTRSGYSHQGPSLLL